MKHPIHYVLEDLTENQVDDVYLYALSRVIGPSAHRELANPDDFHYEARAVKRLLDWGLVDHFSYRKTALGKRLIRKFPPPAE